MRRCSFLVLLVLLVVGSGCGSGCGSGSSDTTVHGHVTKLREANQIGWVSRAELAGGTSPWRFTRSVKGDSVKVASSPEAGRICFQLTRDGYDARKENAEHLRSRLNDDLRSGAAPSWGIHIHDSFDDFGEKAAFPATNVVPTDVKIVDIGHISAHETLASRDKPFHNADGTVRHRYGRAEHTVTMEVCGELPAMTDRTKLLSLSSRPASTSSRPESTESTEQGGIVLWEVRP